MSEDEIKELHHRCAELEKKPCMQITEIFTPSEVRLVKLVSKTIGEHTKEIAELKSSIKGYFKLYEYNKVRSYENRKVLRGVIVQVENHYRDEHNAAEDCIIIEILDDLLEKLGGEKEKEVLVKSGMSRIATPPESRGSPTDSKPPSIPKMDSIWIEPNKKPPSPLGAVLCGYRDRCEKCSLPAGQVLGSCRKWNEFRKEKPPSKELIKSVQEVWERDYKDDVIYHQDPLKFPVLDIERLRILNNEKDENPSEQDIVRDCTECDTEHLYDRTGTLICTEDCKEVEQDCSNCQLNYVGSSICEKCGYDYENWQPIEKEVAEPLAGSASARESNDRQTGMTVDTLANWQTENKSTFSHVRYCPKCRTQIQVKCNFYRENSIEVAKEDLSNIQDLNNEKDNEDIWVNNRYEINNILEKYLLEEAK